MLKVVKCSLIILAAFILSSCNKDEVPVSTSSLASVTTGNAVTIASDSAVVSGIISPNGYTTTYFFQYGKDTSQTMNNTKSVTVNPEQQSVNINDVLTKLTSNSRYFYRAAASNSIGTSYGQFMSFTTADAPMADYFQHFAVGDTSLWSYSEELKETTTHSTEIEGVILWKVISISSSNGITTTTIQRKFTGSRYTFDAISPWDTTHFIDDISYFTVEEDANHNIKLNLSGQGGNVNFSYRVLNFNRFQVDKGEEITLPASTETYSSFTLSKKYGFTRLGQARVGMTGLSVSYRFIH